MAGSPLERRLHFVVGKGGVGKTTVAAALARMVARRGRRTLAVEVDDERQLASVFGVRNAATGVPAEVAANLHVVAIEGRAALEEYLGLLIPIRRLLTTVFSSKVYQYFVAAAPGLKELMTVGKIWYEATRAEHGRPVWDAVVVDAPATGHSLQYLRMPQAARDTFGAGLVQREAAKIVDVLRDPRTTAVHLVTLAEEMPVAETLETHAQLTGPLALPLGWVVANRVHRRRFAADVLAALDGAARRAAGADRAVLTEVAARAAEEQGWTDINESYLAKLRAAVHGDALVELPYLFAEEFGAAEIERLSAELEGAVAKPAGAARRHRR